MHDSIVIYRCIYIYTFRKSIQTHRLSSIYIYILKVDGLEWTCDDRIYKLPKNNAQNAIASE